MERDFFKFDGDVTVIASSTKKFVEIWSIGEQKITYRHIDIGIGEAFGISANLFTSWRDPFACAEDEQIDQMIWEGSLNGN